MQSGLILLKFHDALVVFRVHNKHTHTHTRTRFWFNLNVYGNILVVVFRELNMHTHPLNTARWSQA